MPREEAKKGAADATLGRLELFGKAVAEDARVYSVALPLVRAAYARIKAGADAREELTALRKAFPDEEGIARRTLERILASATVPE